MHLNKEEQNILVSFVTLLISIFLFCSVFWIRHKGRFIQSARLLPELQLQS